MEKRYKFSGFTFGDKGYYVLQVQINNYSEIGTAYTASIDLELTNEERQELITNLITLNAGDN